MGFSDAISTCFRKYFTLSGRAPRSEFWWFALFVIVVSALLNGLDVSLFGTGMMTGNGFAVMTQHAPFSRLFGLIVLLPSIAVAVRRLHDANHSGWWWWIFLVPLVGWIVLVVFYATEGTRGENRYGPDPLAGGRAG